jgi:hypothetical protein
MIMFKPGVYKGVGGYTYTVLEGVDGGDPEVIIQFPPDKETGAPGRKTFMKYGSGAANAILSELMDKKEPDAPLPNSLRFEPSMGDEDLGYATKYAEAKTAAKGAPKASESWSEDGGEPFRGEDSDLKGALASVAPKPGTKYSEKDEPVAQAAEEKPSGGTMAELAEFVRRKMRGPAAKEGGGSFMIDQPGFNEAMDDAKDDPDEQRMLIDAIRRQVKG